MKSQQLLKKVTSLRKKSVMTIVHSPSAFKQTNFEILRALTTSGKIGVFVSLTLNCKNIAAELKRKKGDPSALYIIDATGTDKDHVNNCSHISSREAITELSLAINLALETGKFDYLVFSAADTMSTYNSVKLIERFFIHVISEIRKSSTAGIILAGKEGASRELMGVLAQFSDELIKI